MLKLVALSFVVAALGDGVATNTAYASVSKQVEIHKQLKRYYHANGYIKAIGKVARRTIYSPNPVISHKWRKAVKWLIHVRADAKAKISSMRAPNRPLHYNDWLCIHKYEGSWTDSGAPYYGGLQMDWGFMNTYGHDLLMKKGTADNWTPLEQMQVAEKAYSSGRGFYPWPNTARECGLL